MSYRTLSRRAAGALGLLVIATGVAHAGGLAIHEQSAYAQGSSFAGIAAGGSLSAMFWNPATMTQQGGLQSESVLTGIFPSTTNTATGGTYAGFPFSFGDTGNIAHDAIVPTGYYSWQVNPNLWVGLAANSPFGIAETFPDRWAGRVFAAGGENLMTFNFTPSVAYKISDILSVGLGVQIQYAHASFTQGLPSRTGSGLTQQAGLSGSGYGFGWTAGVTVTPTPTTSIGLGYRSAIDQDINGTLVLPGGFGFIPPVSTPGSVNTTLKLPGMLSLGVKQQLTPQWTVLGTVEWTNWSRIGTSNILQPNGSPALIGLNQAVIPFEWKDGWFFSLGAEYQWNPQLALRAGVAFEKSPVTDSVRGPIIPDDDRTWLSIGATYNFNAKTTIDLAYSHGFVKSAPINITSPSNPLFAIGGGTTYTGNVDSHFDIISVGLRYRWDNPAPAKLVTKG